MSDANRILISYVAESSFGVFPSGPAPTLKDVRITSESLKQNNNATQSQELRSDRQVADIIRQGISASGSVNFEFSYSAFDDWLQYLLQSSGWAGAQTIDSADTDIAAVASGNKFTHTTAWAVTPTANQWIRVSGFANAANNGYFKVSSATSTEIVVTGGTLVDESATPPVTITQGDQIVNGTTLTTMSMERDYQDLSGSAQFAQYLGMALDTFTLDTNTDGILTGAFGLIGKKGQSASATGGDGSNTAAPTKPVMNAVDNVKKIVEAGSSYGVTQIGMSIANNLRARQQVGTLGAISLGSGTMQASGSHTAYYDDETVIDKYLNDTETSLAQVFEDSNTGGSLGLGNGYVIDFPRVKYTDGQRVGGGINQDVLAQMQWQAFRHATELVTVRIARFPEA